MSLRQIDMNLLCQLWSLNETIQVIFRKCSHPPRRTLFGILGHFSPLFTSIPRISQIAGVQGPAKPTQLAVTARVA